MDWRWEEVSCRMAKRGVSEAITGVSYPSYRRRKMLQTAPYIPLLTPPNPLRANPHRLLLPTPLSPPLHDSNPVRRRVSVCWSVLQS